MISLIETWVLERSARLVEELGFDAAIDYKAGDLRAQLKAHAPNGVDVFFDNVGGEALEAALAGGADRPTTCS